MEDRNFLGRLVQERANAHGIRITVVFHSGALRERVVGMKERDGFVNFKWSWLIWLLGAICCAVLATPFFDQPATPEHADFVFGAICALLSVLCGALLVRSIHRKINELNRAKDLAVAAISQHNERLRIILVEALIRAANQAHAKRSPTDTDMRNIRYGIVVSLIGAIQAGETRVGVSRFTSPDIIKDVVADMIKHRRLSIEKGSEYELELMQFAFSDKQGAVTPAVTNSSAAT